MKNQFLNVCTGISMVIVAASLFVFSVISLNAEPTPELFEQQQTNKIGKYMMCAVHSDALRVIVWDTETGNSKIYVRSRSGFKPNIADDQLPSDPLR
ncbi:hypothetical protein N6H18_18415 [Reichenbachiella agarivorans]|uniref:Uncharacterized protein n=1 Tax=Reichenbachiella agarivorans TaxID=2979464 RepID=A0ABY6CP75_9BACT|nr:hypothetical protein [Reichenbachiella agarivorans]UXP32316.1 hypothetical protein N6H18_18415 [Reichenbachiella agarivorans]